MKAIVIWGTQLSLTHHSALDAYPDAPVIMVEARNVCSKHHFHKQKLAFVLTAMREYCNELAKQGRAVWYSRLEAADDDWFEELEKICNRQQVDSIVVMRASDRSPQQTMETWCKSHDIQLETRPNTLFLTPTSTFNEWAEDHPKRLHLEQFYRWQRQRLKILISEGGKPEGGKWNYDSDNRQPLPKDYQPPKIALPKPSPEYAAVKQLVETEFKDHPGTLYEHWLPTTRQQALDWLKDFIQNRFQNFGAYEDAMLQGETFLNHSALSALLNIGLLHPSEVIEAALQAKDIPLSGREGFVRQIIGWREFMFGLYNYKPLAWKDSNYFGHTAKLEDYWWQLGGDIPEPPLQDVLDRLKKYGYSHHIERLMVLGNYMLLKGYDPQQIYEWFLTMYVDAYEWVMVPNVIGMSQFADGGIEQGGFATKPYISGSNYLQKMGNWWHSAQAAKDSDWAEAYWVFLERHEDKLRKNFRLAPLYRNVDRRKT